MRTYDLIVIGSGPAGETGAALAASLGKSVAIIEREVVPGGACVNTGTIPSKTLRESAMHLSGFKQRGLFGVDMSMDNITVRDFTHRERQVVEKEWDLIEENLRWHQVDRYRGIGRFASAHEIVVDTSGYDVTLHSEVILIATGSSPFRPPKVPFDDVCLCDSDSILRLDRIPKTMAVVGAGVIGCEYASIFAALGVDVTLLDGRTELLGNVDREIVDVLMRLMRNRWKVQMQIGVDVEAVTLENDQVKLKLSTGRQLTVDKALYAAGRQSNIADLQLEKVGVETGKRGLIPVNEDFQTNVPHIYAAGDVIGFPALASTSAEQARVAMVHAFDTKHKTKLAPLLPYGIYTIPEISMIGLTEEECLEKGLDYEVGRGYYRNNPRGQIIGDTSGMLKIIFDADSRKLLGIHLIGENASDLIHVGMMVMLQGGIIDAFTQAVFNYPTLGDIYKYAAYDGLSRVARRQKQKNMVLSEAKAIGRRLARQRKSKAADASKNGAQNGLAKTAAPAAGEEKNNEALRPGGVPGVKTPGVETPVEAATAGAVLPAQAQSRGVQADAPAVKK